MRKSIRLSKVAGTAVAIAMLAGACGSGEQLTAPDVELNSGATEGAETTPDDVNEGLSIGYDPAFCEASADFWIANQARGLINRDSPTQVRLAFQTIDQRLNEAIAAAPNDDLAAPAQELQRVFTPILEAVEDANFAWLDVVNGPDFATIQPDIDAYDVIVAQLESFLSNDCAQDVSLLAPLGEELAAVFAAEPEDELAEGAQANATTQVVEDPTSRIRVQVPVAWSSAQPAQSGATASMIVSPDPDLFATSWGVDGVQLSMAEVAGAIDWRSPMYETAAANACTIVDSKPYQDQAYTGWIDSYADCPGGGTAVIIGATDAELQFEILVEVQLDSIETDLNQLITTLIVDSFEVR